MPYIKLSSRSLVKEGMRPGDGRQQWKGTELSHLLLIFLKKRTVRSHGVRIESGSTHCRYFFETSDLGRPGGINRLACGQSDRRPMAFDRVYLIRTHQGLAEAPDGHLPYSTP